jgi:hypothetical protein
MLEDDGSLLLSFAHNRSLRSNLPHSLIQTASARQVFYFDPSNVFEEFPRSNCRTRSGSMKSQLRRQLCAANEVGIHQADGNGGGLIVTATVPRFVRKRRGTHPSIIDQTVERQE